MTVAVVNFVVRNPNYRFKWGVSHKRLWPPSWSCCAADVHIDNYLSFVFCDSCSSFCTFHPPLKSPLARFFLVCFASYIFFDWGGGERLWVWFFYIVVVSFQTKHTITHYLHWTFTINPCDFIFVLLIFLHNILLIFYVLVDLFWIFIYEQSIQLFYPIISSVTMERVCVTGATGIQSCTQSIVIYHFIENFPSTEESVVSIFLYWLYQRIVFTY